MSCRPSQPGRREKFRSVPSWIAKTVRWPRMRWMLRSRSGARRRPIRPSGRARRPAARRRQIPPPRANRAPNRRVGARSIADHRCQFQSSQHVERVDLDSVGGHEPLFVYTFCVPSVHRPFQQVYLCRFDLPRFLVREDDSFQPLLASMMVPLLALQPSIDLAASTASASPPCTYWLTFRSMSLLRRGRPWARRSAVPPISALRIPLC